jgi:hypothetical protein
MLFPSRLLRLAICRAAFRLAFRYIPLHACPLLLQADTHKLILLPPIFAYFSRFPRLEKGKSQKSAVIALNQRDRGFESISLRQRVLDVEHSPENCAKVPRARELTGMDITSTGCTKD